MYIIYINTKRIKMSQHSTNHTLLFIHIYKYINMDSYILSRDLSTAREICVSQLNDELIEGTPETPQHDSAVSGEPSIGPQ